MEFTTHQLQFQPTPVLKKNVKLAQLNWCKRYHNHVIKSLKLSEVKTVD